MKNNVEIGVKIAYYLYVSRLSKITGGKIKMNELQTTNGMSLENVSQENRVKLFNAMNNAEASLSDMVGQTIDVVGYFVNNREDIDDKTGEIKETHIVTVIDKDGKAYATNSSSFIDALKLASNIFKGDWNEKPLKITPIQKKAMKSSNKYLTFVVNE